MTLIGFGSVTARPGVTSFALAVAAGIVDEHQIQGGSVDDFPGVLIEASKSGGVVGQTFGFDPTQPHPGLTTFGSALREQEKSSFRKHCQVLPGGTPWMGLPQDPWGSAQLLTNVGAEILGSLAQDPSVIAIADLGRLGPDSGPLAAQCKTMILICEEVEQSLVTSLNYLKGLKQRFSDLEVMWGLASVKSGTSPRPEDIASHSGFEVAVQIPFDSKGAAMLWGKASSSKSLNKTQLVRTARTFARDLYALSPPQLSAVAAPTQQLAPSSTDTLSLQGFPPPSPNGTKTTNPDHVARVWPQ